MVPKSKSVIIWDQGLYNNIFVQFDKNLIQEFKNYPTFAIDF